MKSSIALNSRSVVVLIAWIVGLSPSAIRAGAPLAATRDAWPISRGDAMLSGTSPARVPARPVLRWHFDAASRFLAAPVVERGIVYAVAADGTIYALRLADGKPVWSVRLDDGVEASPLVADGTLYVGDTRGRLHALNTANGRRKWVYAAGDRIMGGANWIPGKPPLVLVGSYDHHLHAIDARTGQPVWTYETGHYVNGIPAIGDGLALIGGCDERIHAIRLKDGAPVTVIEAGSYVAASPAIRDGSAYVGHYNGEVLGMDLAAGTVRWRFAAEGAPAFFASLAVTPTRVLAAGRHGILHCLSRDDGREIWRFEAQGNIDSAPVVAHDRVLFGSDDGRISMLRFDTGERVWSYLVGSPVTAALAVVEGWIVAGANDGVLYAFGEAP